MSHVISIPLRNRAKEIVAYAMIDPADEALVSSIRWHRVKGYARTSKLVNGKIIYTLMHRLLMGTPDNLHVDHINGNRLDNRRENLRNVTVAQNQTNRQNPMKNNKTGVEGVHWCKSRGEYRACISQNKKQTSVGAFSNIEDAAIAVKYAREKAGYLRA